MINTLHKLNSFKSPNSHLRWVVVFILQISKPRQRVNHWPKVILLSRATLALEPKNSGRRAELLVMYTIQLYS